MVILVIELIHELFDQDCLLIDNLRASGFLSLNFLIELLAVFLLFEFLPVPIDFDILLMRRDNFILNLIGSFLLGLIL